MMFWVVAFVDKPTRIEYVYPLPLEFAVCFRIENPEAKQLGTNMHSMECRWASVLTRVPSIALPLGDAQQRLSYK